MKHFKEAGLVMALVLVACVGATPASATRVDPTGTAITLTSTNSSLTVHGASSINCTSSTISGTSPSTTAETLTIPINLSYSGCTAFGIAGAVVSVPPACTIGGSAPVTLHLTGDTAATATARVTLHAGCTITVHVPSISCTVTIHGPQTIGPFDVHNGTSPTRTVITLGNALVNPITVDPGGGFGCPTAGAHTGTLAGTYTVSSGAAPGAVVTP